MITIGEIVTFWSDDSCYYMGVVMDVNNDIITVQDLSQEQYDVPKHKVKRATPEDMMEELRSIYGFYH